MTRAPAQVDVVVIGAGPAGSVGAAALARQGRSVLCLERKYFPRMIVGESLLPRCNYILEQVGMLDAIEARRYQTKRGAVFARGADRERFCFAEALPGDLPSTYQVPRDDFDQTLATCARSLGVDLRFGYGVESVRFEADRAIVSGRDDESRSFEVEAKFVLDCSGYGRVLARLLDLERPTTLPRRVAAFAHVEGDNRPSGELEGDIWICSHPEGGWIWIIPFSNGRTSVGVVCDGARWDALEGTPADRWRGLIETEPNAQARLARTVAVQPLSVIDGYSKSVTQLHGDRWALAGNTGHFLDPIFSSGVSLALESAWTAAGLVDRVLEGEHPDWAGEYDAVVDRAVGVFEAFVERWYGGQLEQIFFAKSKSQLIKRQITSILGGHVLRSDNPIAVDPNDRLDHVHRAIERFTS